MKIGRLLLLFQLATLFLALVIVVLAVILRIEEIEIENAEHRRLVSYKLADELRQSSDDLTRFARTFAITGNIRYRDYYFQTLQIRNGEIVRPETYDRVYWDLVIAGNVPEPSKETEGAISLEGRMTQAGFTLDEFSLLKEAQNRSDELVRLEEVAMNAVEGRFDDGTGLFDKVGPPNIELATRILHDASYHAAKARIMEPIGEFLLLVDQRTEADLATLNQYSRAVLFGIIVASVLLLAVITGMVWVLRSRFIGPSHSLMDTVEKISGGDLNARSAVSGQDELGVLGSAIDRMTSRLSSAIDEAKNQTSKAEEKALALSEERNRSEKLLHNILPAVIAERLQTGESMIADTFPEVTVLFADIVGFTKLSEFLGPREVVSMLNDIFGRFDKLVDDHNLEKIKTIGDCYMVVGGVPDRSPTHCQQVAEFAIAALQSFNDYAADFDQPLEMRIGIHTGTVVAGIVGTSKFSYDLWGDVVNVASRYESSSAPGKIHISESVKIRLADDFVFEEAGKVEMKGKGKMPSWFLVSNKNNDTTVIDLEKRRRN